MDRRSAFIDFRDSLTREIAIITASKAIRGIRMVRAHFPPISDSYKYMTTVIRQIDALRRAKKLNRLILLQMCISCIFERFADPAPIRRAIAAAMSTSADQCLTVNLD